VHQYSVAWIVLVLELFLQVIIRPDDYHKLLRNEQACNPSTVRFINSFHLFFEGLALLLVVPDFLPIFGVNPFISSVEASIYSVVGKSISRYILGHLYFFTTRLRLFCLVRHKRTHWINALYLGKKDAVRTKFDPMSSVKDLSHKPENLWTKREVSWSKLYFLITLLGYFCSHFVVFNYSVSDVTNLLQRMMKTNYWPKLQKSEAPFSL
jgi:hypothetical protein